MQTARRAAVQRKRCTNRRSAQRGAIYRCAQRRP
jgi:hypothetical protein